MQALTMLAFLAAASPDGLEAPDPPQHCADLLGDAADVDRNRKHRERVLEYLEASGDDVTVIHSGAWNDATYLALAGVKLVAVDPADHTATLGMDLEGVCEGEVEIEVDENIGTNIRVVAVTPHAVLVERQGQLRYLPLGPVDIDVVWSSPYTVAGPVKSSPVRKVPPRRR